MKLLEDKHNDATSQPLTPPLSVMGLPTDSPYPPFRVKGVPGTAKVHDRTNVPKLTVNTKIPPLHKHPWDQYTHRPNAFMRDRPHLEGWESGTTPDSVVLATYLKGPSFWDDRYDTEPPTPADDTFTPCCHLGTEAQVRGWLQGVEEDQKEDTVHVLGEQNASPPEIGVGTGRQEGQAERQVFRKQVKREIKSRMWHGQAYIDTSLT